jgi:hypothetical protein
MQLHARADVDFDLLLFPRHTPCAAAHGYCVVVIRRELSPPMAVSGMSLLGCFLLTRPQGRGLCTVQYGVHMDAGRGLTP